MNRNLYQLVFSVQLGKFVPQPETARRRGKSPGSVTLSSVALRGVLATSALLAGALSAPSAFAVLPTASTGLNGQRPFVTYGQASYTQNSPTQAVVSQVGDRSILNWQNFNLSTGSTVQFQQVDSLSTKNLVQGASFTSLNRIWDLNPSLIAGSITQAAGQQANVIMVNNNGIMFMNGAQVNVNSFTATSLNIADKYITGNFLGDNLNPQFTQDTTLAPGFVTVLEGAQITAGSQGRVMLIAPTVTNRGSITAPDGQIILAAGTKAYLRSNDNSNYNLRGLLVEVDNDGVNNYTTANTSVPSSVTLDGVTQQTNAAQNILGQASNTGTLSTPRGNITMVGLAVNQSGIAKATTSVVSNGSIYLMAKDTSVVANSVVAGSSRGGQVVLGAGSSTQVAIETSDATTTTDNATLGGTGLDRASEVRVTGKDIYMAGSASIVAPSGTVAFTATANPYANSALTDALGSLSNAAESGTRVQIASGATIDVSGLQNVDVSVARDVVAVQLRGDELKDSPVNQVGPLRGTTVYVDIDRALANSNAGKATLIAADSLAGYAGQLQRTAAERATSAGTVSIQSTGEAIVESGVKVNLSGGSVNYTGAYVPQSLLSANGVLTDAADALAGVRYTGISTNLSVTYGRWNHTDTYTNGAVSSRYDAGYVEGKNAGTLSLQSIGTAVMQASVVGKTTVGAQQIANAALPTGATLQIGTDFGATGSKDYKINQAVSIGNGITNVVAGLVQDAALSTVESAPAQQTLELDANLMGNGGVANLRVYSNQDVTTSASLNTSQKGSVQLTGTNVTVGGNITAASGNIALNAVANNYVDPNQLASTGMGVTVQNGVTLSTAGVWRNDRPAVANTSALVGVVDGGGIAISAGSPAQNGTIALGAGTLLDASGGAHLLGNGTVVAGTGGAISLSADAVTGVVGAVQSYGLKKGGSFTLSTTRVKIGGALESTYGTLNLAPLFFTQGGFSSYALNGNSSLELAANTLLQPRQTNWQITTAAATAATGASMASITRQTQLQDNLRTAVNLTLSASNAAQSTGTLALDTGSDIELDKGATATFKARNAMTVQGTVRAQGGAINLTLDQSNSVNPVNPENNLLWIANGAVLDASGVAQTTTDARGGLQGKVLAGGSVTITANSGYAIAEAGSTINVNGAAPVTLDVRNAAGGLGQVVASDAGSIKVFGEEGVVLQSNLQAQGGSAAQRGGSIEVDLSHNATPDVNSGFDLVAREIHVAATQATQTSGVSATAPASITGTTSRANLAWDVIQNSGADNVTLVSRDAIVLDNGLNASSGRALALQTLTLDAARIQSNGSVALAADTVTLGNSSAARVGTNTSAGTNGTLTVNSRKLSLLGNLHLQGMAQSNLNASELIELDGVTRTNNSGNSVSAATITSDADVSLTSPILTTSSDTSVVLNATGKTVAFHANGSAPYQPYSVAGSLTVNAQNIEQAGHILMPFGAVDLEATAGVTLDSGSLISVADQTGATLPLGQLVNGTSWVVNLDPSVTPSGQQVLANLPQKSVVVKGNTVNMQAGSSVNVAGGGDVQAYEFTVGPGGSKDILAAANTYAILPGYKGSFAPNDPQEAFALRSGTAVYLSGVPGLAAGVYTLLPAHYALLPGAYAVKLNTGVSILPGQSYTQQDGVQMAAGYLTDTRSGAPTDATWQGIQVLTNAQVHARSELTVTTASQFFANAANRPADAGSVAITTTGTGASSLQLNGQFSTAAGSGGNGATVDLSAANLALVSGSTAGIDTNLNTVVDVSTLNAMNASSLLLGGTRSSSTDATSGVTTTALNVGASTITLANDAAHALQAPEVILAATDTVNLKVGSAVTAQGTAQGTGSSAANYTTAGMGALVRVANTDATFVRTGAPGNTAGTLIGDASSALTASKAVLLDATSNNAFKGSTTFTNNGQAVAGSLGIGAPRVNFGNAPLSATGISYNQAALDGFAQLGSIAFTSYSTFDFYGDVNIGGLSGNGSPTLGSLALHGAGLAGLGSASNSVNLRAVNVLLDNPGAASFTPGGTLGSGALQITANNVTLGAGVKTLSGFATQTITAQQLLGQGTGSTSTGAPVTVNVARISGAAGSKQSLTSTGAVALNAQAATGLADVTALGASWAVSGSSVQLNTAFVTPSGSVTLTATGTSASDRDVAVGATGSIDVSGRSVAFFDQSRASAGGTATLSSAHGNVVLANQSVVNVSAVAGGDAGSLTLSASNGSVQLAAGSVAGTNAADASGNRGQGAQISVDTGTLDSFSTLNTAEAGGFSGARNTRVRSGDVTVAASDAVSAQTVTISADSGALSVAGSINANGTTGGDVGLYANGNVTLQSGASITAMATGSSTANAGGKVEFGATTGNVNLVAGSSINVSGATGATQGALNLRAARNGSDVNVTALDSTISGARTVTLEAVQTYGNTGTSINTLNLTGASSGNTLSLATINSDNTNFAANFSAITGRLQQSSNSAFSVRSGVEVQSSGDLTLNSSSANANGGDWNLLGSRAGGTAGFLTVRAAGNLVLNSSISDGFSTASPLSNSQPSTLSSGDSWGLRLVAGADTTAANILATGSTAKNLTLAASKLVRTGTGDIKVAASGNITLTNTGSVIYTAGNLNTDSVAGFVAPPATQNAYFTRNGGDVSLTAGGDITGSASSQLYSEWLFREGEWNTAGTGYKTGSSSGNPAWWVRFDQFKQGVAALGGGAVTVSAGGSVRNVSVSSVSQGRVGVSAGNAFLSRTGGGNVTVKAAGDILGGEYFADAGTLHLQSAGKIDTGQNDTVTGKPIYTVLAASDGGVQVDANGDVNLQAIVNPTLLPQSKGAAASAQLYNISTVAADAARLSAFSTYGANTALDVTSLDGNVTYMGAHGSNTAADMNAIYPILKGISGGVTVSTYDGNYGTLATYLPGTVSMAALQSNVTLGKDASGATMVQAPAANGQLDLLAKGSVKLNASVTMNDSDPTLLASVLNPSNNAAGVLAETAVNAVTPVHTNDANPAHFYAVTGDVTEVSTVTGVTNRSQLTLPKALDVRAGQDIVDFSAVIANSGTAQVSSIQAGRDITFTPAAGSRNEQDSIEIAGTGSLNVVAGRNVSLGTSGGIVSVANLLNANLPSQGADIHVAAGVGSNGIDYAGAVSRLLSALQSNPSDATLWQARWLVGDNSLTAANASVAVQAVAALTPAALESRVRNWVFTALNTTGTDYNASGSKYAGDYSRGYAALDFLFPGVQTKDASGNFSNYQGSLNLFASRIKSESSGNIDFLVPGGDTIVGLANTPAALVNVGNNVLGIVVSAAGNINGFSRDDITVNQSRILTVGGGDLTLWSSEGGIDAGKGKKTASAVPPPIITVDSQGNVTQTLSGAATGSGIGALAPAGGSGGNVDLIAPKGTVNAGDAGIRAGNLNVAAADFKGADNVTVSGHSAGVPVADTSAVSAAASGASSTGDDASKTIAAASQAAAEAARSAQLLASSFKPGLVSVDVLGYGE